MSDFADVSAGREAGVISDARWARFTRTRDEIARVTDALKAYTLSPQVRLGSSFFSYFLRSCLAQY